MRCLLSSNREPWSSPTGRSSQGYLDHDEWRRCPTQPSQRQWLRRPRSRFLKRYRPARVARSHRRRLTCGDLLGATCQHKPLLAISRALVACAHLSAGVPPIAGHGTDLDPGRRDELADLGGVLEDVQRDATDHHAVERALGAVRAR
jgi:hypothetical protein